MPRSKHAPHSADDSADLFSTPVASATASSRRVFLGWELPLVQGIVGHLVSGWSGRGVLDLTDLLIVVPTRNASRRLREALAVHAAKFDAAVLPPMTVTPDFLTSPERLREVKAAGKVETALIWTAELLGLDLDGYRALFPVDPVERSFSWALKTAGDLLQVRETLNESGLSLIDAARMLDGSEMEPERWRDLAKLERACLRATEAKGMVDWQVTRRSAASVGAVPAGVQKVVLAGVLDPSALAIEALARWSRALPVEVLIFAPEVTHRDHFDDWGRPEVERWLSETVHILSPDETIHQGSNPAEQAEVAIELLAHYPEPGAVAALGIADPEVSAPLEKALELCGIGAYDPAGRPMAMHGVFHLLGVVNQVLGTEAFGAVADLIRCPDVAETIRRMYEIEHGSRPSLKGLLEALDRLSVKALPDTLEDAIELAPRALGDEHAAVLLLGLRWIQRTVKALSGQGFAAALMDFLAEVFAGRRFRTDRPQDAIFAAIADQMAEVLDALDGPAAAFPGELSAANRMELLLLVLEEQVYYSERGARDIDLQGWLELLWEDAPHLVITGMNDGKVPEAIMGHQFLPDSARRALGLRHNETRFARDACLMTTAIESRKANGGRVDFVFGRIGAGAEPLRPSRLLFQCPDEELPDRTLQFFEKPHLRVDPVSWQLAWPLKPQPLPEDCSLFKKLSVTQFRDYLMCPFRFYLKHGLKMEEVDVARTEMDPLEFGNLLHHVMETFAKEGETKTLTDATKIEAEFHAMLDRYLHGVYGARLTVPVIIQRESARQRLSWWAEFEARERREGWRIEVAETRISPEGDPWEVAGMIVSGIVDRVEVNDHFGVRLIDFKTYSPYNSVKRQRKTVEEYHLAKLKRTEDEEAFPAWMLTSNSAGELARWTDLQLPLYRLAMERRYPGAKIQTAYATLGKTKIDIGLDPWPQLEGQLLASAWQCAEGIIHAVRSRTFWPPAEKIPYSDAFGALFFGDVLKAVDPSAITNVEVGV